jgi:hypothetical protein
MPSTVSVKFAVAEVLRLYILFLTVGGEFPELGITESGAVSS